MNVKLIQKLSKQAGAEIDGHPDYANICVNDQDADALMKDFTKIIVRECVARIQGCHLVEGYDSDEVGDFERGYQRAINKAASQVLLHFGV